MSITLNKSNEVKQRKLECIILWGITILFLAINMLRIFNDSISGDEGYTLSLIKMDIPALLNATGGDVHPPLYYLIVKFFALFMGPSAISGRMVSFLPVIATVVIVNLYLKKNFSTRSAIIFTSLILFTKNCIEMTVEIRMYTWALLFVTLTGIFAYEILKKSTISKWILLVVFGLASAYSHYYALISVAFIFGFLFVAMVIYNRKNIWYCIGAAVAAILGYLPWLFVLLKQFNTVSDGFWISNVEIKEYIRFIFGNDRFGKTLRMLLFACVIIYLFTKEGIKISRKKKVKAQGVTNDSSCTDVTNDMTMSWDWHLPFDADRLFIILCGLAAGGTILVGTAVSLLIRPMFLARYTYPAMGLVCIAFGIAFTKCSKKSIYTWILVAAISVFGMIHFMDVYQFEKDFQTEDAKEYFSLNLDDDDIFVTNIGDLSWTVLRYYYPDHTIYYSDNYDIVKGALEDDFGTIWYLERDLNGLPLQYEEWKNVGCDVTFMGKSGIGRTQYQLFKIEKE